MSKSTIHLGYEVGTGKAVAIPVSHLCVTGQTQLSGKTTTLEALISRSGLKAIAFVTKRGEGAFQGGLGAADGEQYLPNVFSLAPFFKHKADWQFVSQLLGSVLNEKLKQERYWIIKICRGAKSLAQVLKNAEDWLDSTRKFQDVQVLTTIVEYFKLFMPELEALPYTDKLKLQPGLNVMDLSDYSLPLQMLVISAVVEEVYTSQKNVLTVIPEAWEFIPNGKNSPAKAAVRGLIRKGAALHNFVLIDSQDLAGIDTEVRRQATAVLLLGVQRDENEIKRTLAHIPRIPAKLKVEDIMTLERGQFWVCFGSTVVKVYVQPAWMSEEVAVKIATGVVSFAQLELQSEHFNAHRKPTTEIPSVGYAPREYVEKSLPCDWQKLDRLSDDYQRPSAGATFTVDDTQKEIEDVDDKERKAYQERAAKDEAEIRRLNEQVKRLTLLIEDLNSDSRADQSIGFTSAEASRGPCEESNSRGNYLYQHEIVDDPKLLEKFANALLPYLPTNGVIKVEPREVVLKRFQTEEVKRILADVEGRSVFQKQLIAFLEARDTGVKKIKAITAVTGKDLTNMKRDCASEYKDIRELAAMGLIREDIKNGVVYPNLGVGIKKRVEQFEPSNEDVDQIIGQVMLQLK